MVTNEDNVPIYDDYTCHNLTGFAIRSITNHIHTVLQIGMKCYEDVNLISISPAEADRKIGGARVKNTLGALTSRTLFKSTL